MRSKTFGIAMVLASWGMLVGAAPAQTQAAFCPALKKIIAATAETPRWKSVRKGKAGIVAPAGYSKCIITNFSGESTYGCSRASTAATIKPAYARLVADVGSCLGLKPQASSFSVSTYNVFTLPSGYEVTATSVEQAGNFGLGISVTERF